LSGSGPEPNRRAPTPVRWQLRHYRWPLALLLAALLLWLLGLLHQPLPDSSGWPRVSGSHQADRADANAAAATPMPAAAALADQAAFTQSKRALPASLRGSTPDGAVTLDASGRLRPSIELRRLFDYFLSAIGELDLAAIRTHLLDTVAATEPPALTAEVAALFDRYVDYQAELAQQAAGFGALPVDRLAGTMALRRRFFDAATVTAFFGAEEADAQATLRRLEIGHDPALTSAQREQRWRELEQSLPPELQAQARETTSAVLIEEQSRQFEQLGIAAAQRHRERSAAFGRAAADRLAVLDQQRADWDARRAEYQRVRAAILADAGLGPAERAAGIEQWLQQHFSASEQRRVRALEPFE